ncbi:MAG: hypothetical protein RID07_03220 [Lacipirellulaceae bacterium]
MLELAHLKVYYWIAIICTLGCLATISIAKGFSTDYSGYSSNSIATQVIEEIKHPVEFLQHCSRTIRFSELQLLRIRDIVGLPYGWVLYMFFLIPNALPAFGLVTLFEGVGRSLDETPE